MSKALAVALSAVACIAASSVSVRARAADDDTRFTPIALPFTGVYSVVAEGCDDAEKPVDPIRSRAISVGYGMFGTNLVLAYGENGNGDSGVWFFERTLSPDFTSSFTVTDTGFTGENRLVGPTWSSTIRAEFTPAPTGDRVYSLVEDATQTSDGKTTTGRRCRKLHYLRPASPSLDQR